MVRPLPAGLLLFALAACGSSSGASSRAAASGGSASCRAGSSSARPSGAGSCASTSGGSSAAATTATLHVMAAASLSKAMPLIAQKFEADHPGVHVQFNFAGSADLIAQLKAGAPADVLATADQPTMTKVASLVSNPLPFASNHLVIATAPGNPKRITGLSSLSGVLLVICAPQVPCGAASQKLATIAGVSLHPVSEENSVTDVLGKVTSGEADAGLVYATDVLDAKVATVTIPEAGKVINVDSIASVLGSSQASLAQQFIGTVRGTAGHEVLSELGFGQA